jgi:hypothetical protein
MVDKHSRRGAVDLGAILMVAAFVVIGVFIYWLQQQAATELAVRVVEDTAAAQPTDTATIDARTITPAEIQAGAGAYTGQVVRLPNVGVASGLGRQGIWLDLPSGPFLVSLAPSMIADSTSFSVGTVVTVTGTVRAMSDSAATAWFNAGTIGEGDRLAATFASHFIEAIRIEASPRGGGGSR